MTSSRDAGDSRFLSHTRGHSGMAGRPATVLRPASITQARHPGWYPPPDGVGVLPEPSPGKKARFTEAALDVRSQIQANARLINQAARSFGDSVQSKARDKFSAMARAWQRQPAGTSRQPDAPVAIHLSQGAEASSVCNAWDAFSQGRAQEQNRQQRDERAPDLALDGRLESSCFTGWADVLRASQQTLAQGGLVAYQSETTADGAPRHDRLLNKLHLQLNGASNDPGSYRHAVATMLKRYHADEHPRLLTCMRDYYYFWIGDLRQRSGKVAVPEFATRNIGALRSAPLESLFTRMRQEPKKCSSPALGLYLGDKFEQGLASEELASREMLLNALLVLLRERPFIPLSYRRAVDKLLFISPPCDHRCLVQLVREFFYYWIAFPPAATRNTLNQHG